MKITTAQITAYINAHQAEKTTAKRYRDFEQADIVRRRVIKGEAEDAPKNNIAVNFAASIKDTKVGYMYGIPFKAKYLGDDRIDAILQELFVHNDKGELSLRTGEEMNDVGKTYWLVYPDEAGNLKMKVRPMEEIILIREGNLSERSLAAIRYYLGENENGELRQFVEVFESDLIFYYMEDEKGELILDGKRKLNPAPNLLGYVPVVEFINNGGQSEFKDIYDPSIAYNILTNDSLDEIMETRNTYIKIINGNMDPTTLAMIKTLKVIALDSDPANPSDVSFMSKNLNNTAFENASANLRRRIFELAGVPDLENVNQQAQVMSGAAMKQMLIPLENRCIVKEANMRKALLYFFRIFSEYVKLKYQLNPLLENFSMEFTRKEPFEFTMDDVVKMKALGLFSDEYLLSILPFVRDPKAVLEARNKERAAAESVDYTNYEAKAEETSGLEG